MSVFVLILPNSVGIRGVIHRRVNSMPVGIDFDQSQAYVYPNFFI